MQLGGKVMQRWLAHSIRSMLTRRYPSLRVAYIDLENLGHIPARDPAAAAAAAATGPGQPVMAGPRERGRGGKAHRLLRQYSVLLQYDEARDGVVELYRCAGGVWCMVGGHTRCGAPNKPPYWLLRCLEIGLGLLCAVCVCPARAWCNNVNSQVPVEPARLC